MVRARVNGRVMVVNGKMGVEKGDEKLSRVMVEMRVDLEVIGCVVQVHGR